MKKFPDEISITCPKCGLSSPLVKRLADRIRENEDAEVYVTCPGCSETCCLHHGRVIPQEEWGKHTMLVAEIVDGRVVGEIQAIRLDELDDDLEEKE